MTSRLLAFSRRQPLEPKSVSVNSLIAGMSEILHQTLGETVQIETVLAACAWAIFVDSNQLESALLNLAVNARDAMPEGGKLTIEVANTYLDEAYSAIADVPAGQYVGIFVSDTGTGMTSEVVSKAFDPFFTTKEIGQGTGLGLSQVYGFISHLARSPQARTELIAANTFPADNASTSFSPCAGPRPGIFGLFGGLQRSASAFPMPRSSNLN